MIPRLIGLDQEGPITFFEWFLRNPWGGVVALVLIAAAVVYALYMYRREKSLPVRRRLFLGTLRAVLLAVIICLLFEPVLGFDMQVKLRRTLLVLFDTSESMGIRDARKTPKDIEDAAAALGKVGFGQPYMPISEKDRQDVANASRLELGKAILSNSKLDLFRQLGQDYQVRYFGFGDRLEPSEGKGETVPETLLGVTKLSQSTRLGDAIDEAVSRYSGQAVSGIILLTDGASNKGAEPLDVAKRMKDRGIPIYAVGLGLASPPDVRLKGLAVQDKVFVRDIVPVRFQVQSTGYQNHPVTLSLQIDGKEIARKTFTLTGQPQFFEMTFTPDRVSEGLRLDVVAAPLPGEVNTDNNRLTKTIKVIDDKIKVLYVEGKPRWEFRYLRRVLLRDHRLDTKFLMTEGDKELAQPDNEYVAEFPEDKAKAFHFDLIILGDVPAGYFTAAQLARMEEIVKNGGSSLIMIAGAKHAPMSYANTPLANMLPVKIKTEAPENIDDQVYPLLTTAGYASAMMALEPTKEYNQQLWSVIRPMFTIPSLAGAKPGATVLAELSDKERRKEAYPLIAWQRYGTGKTMFVGTDQLWRIRLKVGDRYHARFWGQTIQFLTLSRLLGANKRIQLETDRTDYQVGERILINANVLNEAYDPANLPSYTVHLQPLNDKSQPTGQPVPVKLDPAAGIPGMFQGFAPADLAPGRYRLMAAQADQAEEIDAEGKRVSISNTVDFTLAPASLEMLEPAMQEDLLVAMAKASRTPPEDPEKLKKWEGPECGYFTIGDLPKLREKLGGQQIPTTIRREKELWDLPIVLAILLTLLAVEWFFRRKYDLL
ncbi:MAG: VWA domain-containing protein [Phycisphaerae bacterium]